jgi:hypothetical protein
MFAAKKQITYHRKRYDVGGHGERKLAGGRSRDGYTTLDDAGHQGKEEGVSRDHIDSVILVSKALM